MASLNLKGVDKIYPSGTLALYDISLNTRDGEFIVIAGADESGKTTLLRVIAGLEDASAGQILIDGKDVTEVEPKDRDLAMVFRGNTLYPSLNVFENMAYGLKARRAPQALVEQRVKSAANILGLNEVLYRKPKTLTAAQRQRVAIGRAIAREPKLYLLDEPLAGLDDKLKSELLNVIVNLQARMEGTFIYSTKNVAEAMTVASRVIIMKNGFVQQIDTPANLYDYPANAYVAFYVGSPSINFLNNSKIVKTEEGYAADCNGIILPLPENIVKRFTDIESYAAEGKTVIAGIRPEDASIGSTFESEVLKVEGEYAECKAGTHTLTVQAEKANVGDKVKLDIDLTHLYLFDGETRLTLLARDEGYENTGFEDADIIPLTFAEEEEVKEKFKPAKDEKKKRK